VTHDAQQRAAATRGQAEPRDSQGAAVTLEPNAGNAEKRSDSPESSRMSISSSASPAEAPSATARATKRPGRNSSEVHSNAKKHSSDSSAEVAAERDDDDPRRKSSSVSHRSRSVAAFDNMATGEEGRREVGPNNKDSLTTARPMDRYERVERYLERSNMLPPPTMTTTNVSEEPQQPRNQRHHKHSSRVSGNVNNQSRKALMAAVAAAMPPKLRRGGGARSNSENESDNDNDAKNVTKKHRRSDGAKKRRHQSSTDRIKYSFPPFDEPTTKKKRKRHGKPRYESPSRSSSSSTKDSLPENASPPSPLPETRRKRSEAVKLRLQRRHHTLSQSSSDASVKNRGRRKEKRQAALAIARGGSVDSVIPTKNHKLSKPIKQISSKFHPDGKQGRRGRNHGRSAAGKLDENDNEFSINEADKDQWRKYFADLYTFNMLQKMKSTKKRKRKRHHDDMDVDNDDDDNVERQNSFYPAPPETTPGDTKPTVFDSSQPTTNHDTSHRVPFNNVSSVNVTLPDVSSASRVPPPSGDIGSGANSWPSLVTKPGATQSVDELSGRQTLLPLPSEPVPLFSLNLSGVMPSVSRIIHLFNCHAMTVTKMQSIGHSHSYAVDRF